MQSPYPHVRRTRPAPARGPPSPTAISSRSWVRGPRAPGRARCCWPDIGGRRMTTPSSALPPGRVRRTWPLPRRSTGSSGGHAWRPATAAPGGRTGHGQGVGIGRRNFRSPAGTPQTDRRTRTACRTVSDTGKAQTRRAGIPVPFGSFSMPAVAHRGRGRTHNRTGWSVGGGRAHRVGRTGASTRAIQGGLCARPPGTRARQGMPLLQPSPRRPDTPGRRPAPRCPAAPDGVPLLPSRRRTAQPFRGRPGGAARGDRARLGRPALSRLPPRRGGDQAAGRGAARPGSGGRHRPIPTQRHTKAVVVGVGVAAAALLATVFVTKGWSDDNGVPDPRATWGAQSSSSLQPSRSADDESSAGSPLPASVGQPVEIGRGRLRNAESGLCLDVGGGRADSGAAAVLAACSSAGSQQWSYQGDGLLRSGVDPTLCLDSDTERHSVDLASCLAHGERRATTSRSAGNSCCAAARGCSSRRARGARRRRHAGRLRRAAVAAGSRGRRPRPHGEERRIGGRRSRGDGGLFRQYAEGARRPAPAPAPGAEVRGRAGRAVRGAVRAGPQRYDTFRTARASGRGAHSPRSRPGCGHLRGEQGHDDHLGHLEHVGQARHVGRVWRVWHVGHVGLIGSRAGPPRPGGPGFGSCRHPDVSCSVH